MYIKKIHLIQEWYNKTILCVRYKDSTIRQEAFYSKGLRGYYELANSFAIYKNITISNEWPTLRLASYGFGLFTSVYSVIRQVGLLLLTV